MASQANSAEPPGGFSITVHYGHLATIRPLLGWRRGELRSLCQEYDIPFIDDPSNDDERFDRTRFRRWLADAPWLDPVQIGRAAAHIAEADRDLLDLSRWLWSQRVSNESPYEVEFDVADLPRGVRRWLARVAIETVRQTNGVSVPAWSYASNIEHLLDSLEAGTAGTQAGVMASANGTRWLFREAPPRRST